MKQTAVEWLCNQIYTIQVELEAGNTKLKNKIDQAKEMEKQQIIDACNQEECFGSSGYGIHEDITKGEEYYNVTFNK